MIETLDAAAALDRFLRLTTIFGPSGQEGAVAQAIITELKEAGVAENAIQFDDAHRRTKIEGQTGNLIVRVAGSTAGPATMLSAHMDTVPICVGSQPQIDGDDVVSNSPATGLGADDRAGCAAILTAAVELLRSGRPHPPLVLCWFVQEEIGLQGSRYLDPSVLGEVDRAINIDGGTVEKLTVGAIGGERMTINVHGIPAHAGLAPEEGVSAIVIAAKAIAALHADGWLGNVQRPDGGEGKSNIGVIQGGDATNVVTPAVQVRAEARSHNPETRQQIVAAIRQAFEAAAAGVTSANGKCGSIEFASHVDYEAFRLDDNAASVTAAGKAVAALGRKPMFSVSNGGVDANWLFRHGISAVTIGCGQRNVHTAEERLHVPDYLDACRVAMALAAGEYAA
ncbi:MAG: M20/M25/M40 family metallo-hydrolase [Pirellulaceae bacterium]